MTSPTEKLRKQIRSLADIRHNPDLLITAIEEIEVCNEKGSHDRSPQCPNCGAWKNHWEKLTGKIWPDTCCRVNCDNKATDGGHIVFAGDITGRCYIVPLCSSCNGLSPNQHYTIKAGTVMISANCSDTCDKLK